MDKRGYNVDSLWCDVKYRGKKCERYQASFNTIGKNSLPAVERMNLGQYIYPEHDDEYLQECLDNLRSKGIEIHI